MSSFVDISSPSGDVPPRKFKVPLSYDIFDSGEEPNPRKNFKPITAPGIWELANDKSINSGIFHQLIRRYEIQQARKQMVPDGWHR
jgi:hypothetical protein